jgi:hypothetical protein
MKPVKSIPKAAKKGKESMYDPTLKQFLESNYSTVELSQKGVDGKKLASGFRQRVKNSDAFKSVQVQTRVINGETHVYLKKK